MHVTLHPTTKVVEIVIGGVLVPARIWEGETGTGIKCHAYVTRIAAKADDDQEEFELELKEERAPTADVAAIPLRLIL